MNVLEKGLGKDIDRESMETFFVEAKTRRYAFVDYEQAGTSSKFVIMRHDVDVDPFYAKELAELEARHEVRSTYFVMLRNPLYNVLSPQVSACLHRIIELGHKVGLHFDVTAYAQLEMPGLLDAIRVELSLLRSVVGIANVSRCVTFHKPAPMFLEQDVETPEFFSGYNRKFFRDIRYIADSCGIWRETSMLDLIRGDPPPKIQFNAHPIWWMAPGRDQAEKFASLIRQRASRSQDDLAFTVNDPSRDLVLYRPASGDSR